MPVLAHFQDKKFAVILVKDKGAKDSDVVVLTGIAKWRDGRLFVHRGMGLPEFPIPDEMLGRIQPVAPEMRDILGGTGYSVMLSVKAAGQSGLAALPSSRARELSTFGR
jgi:hypothetical protein